MDYVLGIDAGGTKTMCLLADEEGHVVSEGRAAGANLATVGELGVEKTLHRVMEDALGARDIVPAAIALGIAGADRPADGTVMRAIMRRIGFKARTVVVNDALVALMAGAADGPGIVMIAGTGSIVYGRNASNHAARAGGWGHVLADEGSGYWMAQQALTAVMREADGRGPRTALTPAILEHFRVATAAELIPLVYARDLPLSSIAAVAPLVGRAREEGDGVASDILTRAAAELVLAAASVVRRLGMTAESFPFLLAGGVFGGLGWLEGEIARRMAAVAPGARVRRLEEQPAIGAVRLALAELAGGAVLPDYV